MGSRLARNEVLGAGGGGGGGGAEALLKPNIIPATRHTRRRWGAVGAGDNVIDNSVSAVGGVPLSVPASGYFVWAISGFSSCSEPCGGGEHLTVIRPFPVSRPALSLLSTLRLLREKNMPCRCWGGGGGGYFLTVRRESG